MDKAEKLKLKLGIEKEVLDALDKINEKLCDLDYLLEIGDATDYKRKLLHDIKFPLRRCYRHLFIWYLRRNV